MSEIETTGFYSVDLMTTEMVLNTINNDENTGWWELHEEGDHKIEGLGTVRTIASIGGGEGCGEYMALVIRVRTRTFRKEGFYASWDGSNWDGPFREVRPVLVERTEWQEIQ
jgi:hypothetical protein